MIRALVPVTWTVTQQLLIKEEKFIDKRINNIYTGNLKVFHTTIMRQSC